MSDENFGFKAKLTLISIALFLFWLGGNYKLPFTRDVPGCFPDYRPGFKCYVWEKLP